MLEEYFFQEYGKDNSEKFDADAGVKSYRKFSHSEISMPSRLKTGNDYIDQIRADYFHSKRAKKAVILLHGFTMDRRATIRFADIFLDRGISTLHLDLPYHGERGFYGYGFDEIPKTIDNAVFAMRQGLDDIDQCKEFLQNEKHKDVSLVGYSLGAVMVLTKLGMSDSFSYSMAAFGGGDLAGLLTRSPIAYDLRRAYDLSYGALKQKLEALDPLTHASKIDPSKLLMVNGRFDDIVSLNHAEQVIRRMDSPPHTMFLNCRHFPENYETIIMDYANRLANMKEEGPIIKMARKYRDGVNLAFETTPVTLGIASGSY